MKTVFLRNLTLYIKSENIYQLHLFERSQKIIFKFYGFTNNILFNFLSILLNICLGISSKMYHTLLLCSALLCFQGRVGKISFSFTIFLIFSFNLLISLRPSHSLYSSNLKHTMPASLYSSFAPPSSSIITFIFFCLTLLKSTVPYRSTIYTHNTTLCHTTFYRTSTFVSLALHYLHAQHAITSHNSTQRMDLKVILMSATLNAELFSNYFKEEGDSCIFYYYLVQYNIIQDNLMRPSSRFSY